MSDSEMGTGPRTVVIQLQPEDLALAQRLHFWQHVRSRGGLIRLAIIWVVATAVFAGLLRLMGDKAVMPVVIFALIAPVAVLAFPYLITHVLGGVAARRTFRQQKPYISPPN